MCRERARERERGRGREGGRERERDREIEREIERERGVGPGTRMRSAGSCIRCCSISAFAGVPIVAIALPPCASTVWGGVWGGVGWGVMLKCDV